MMACFRAAVRMPLCLLGQVCLCAVLSGLHTQHLSNLAVFPQVPVACAGRVLGADFCPHLEEPDQRLEVQVGVLLFYQLGGMTDTVVPEGHIDLSMPSRDEQPLRQE